MIWIDGQLVDASSAGLPLQDAALEHGVGLFETMRAVGGVVPLLDRHLARLKRSAVALGLAVDRARLPGGGEIGSFLESISARTCVVRLTLSGGVGVGAPCCWVIGRELPAISPSGIRVAGRFTLAFDDELARHKTLNHWRRRRLMETARACGADEQIGVTPDGRIWEAIWANFFVVRGGAVLTPTLRGPVLPGVMRGLVIERAAACAIDVIECDLHDLDGEEVFVTNAVRGVVPVRFCEGRELAAPGPITSLLQREIEAWLETESAR